MEKSTAIRDFIIGIVFLGALIILGVASLSVANITVLQKSYYVTVPFQKVDAVRVGDKVQFYGMNVGLVSAIKPSLDQPEYKVQLTCRIDTPIMLPEDSHFLVRSAGPLGGRFIEILPGASSRSVPIELGRFKGDAKGDLFEQLSNLVDEIRSGNGLLQQLVSNETLGANFADTMAEIREIVHSVNEGEGVLGALIKRPDLRDRVEVALADLADSLHDIQEGKGTIGMLVNDAATRDKVKSAIDNLEDISKAIRESKGTAGKLIYEEKIYRDFEDLIGKAKKILSDVEEGKGTIGQLLKNPEVHQRLNRILVQVEDAVEDFREQAPISTFVNAVFAAF
ncbi:MAG: MCE family protein [Planctomycetes bacterium]|nr:MCE family protein [Planctomycetota bacterium]